MISQFTCAYLLVHGLLITLWFALSRVEP
jgi:hypothetical protein